MRLNSIVSKGGWGMKNILVSWPEERKKVTLTEWIGPRVPMMVRPKSLTTKTILLTNIWLSILLTELQPDVLSHKISEAQQHQVNGFLGILTCSPKQRASMILRTWTGIIVRLVATSCRVMYIWLNNGGAGKLRLWSSHEGVTPIKTPPQKTKQLSVLCRSTGMRKDWSECLEILTPIGLFHNLLPATTGGRSSGRSSGRILVTCTSAPCSNGCSKSRRG